MVYLFSNNAYAHQYECDLVKDINNGERGMFSIGISESESAPENNSDVNLKIVLSNDGEKLKEELLSICYVLIAQILGFCKSLNLGLNPDTPSANNVITRVVEGVHIYPFVKGDNNNQASDQ
jgi:tagatose-6-phosphate ketose/aldose isomerase